MTRAPSMTRVPEASKPAPDQAKAQLEQRLRAIQAIDDDLPAQAAADAAGVSLRTVQSWKKDRNELWAEIMEATFAEAAEIPRDDQIANLAHLLATMDLAAEALLTSHSGSRKIVERVRLAWLLDRNFTINRAAGVVGVSYNTAVNWRNRLDQLEREHRADLNEIDEDGEIGSDFLPVLSAHAEATLCWATRGLQLQPERI